MYPNYSIQRLKGRPVASVDEVKAASIDFDGSIFYFPDIANKTIYTKQVNLDGTMSVNIYELKEQTPIEYITKDEFNKAIADLREAMISKPAADYQF